LLTIVCHASIIGQQPDQREARFTERLRAREPSRERSVSRTNAVPSSKPLTEGIEHEFQALGRELEPIFGKRIWAVFHMPKCTEANVRKAYEICKNRGKISYAYFRGVIRNL
jgi:hypothetical protein